MKMLMTTTMSIAAATITYKAAAAAATTTTFCRSSSWRYSLFAAPQKLSEAKSSSAAAKYSTSSCCLTAAFIPSNPPASCRRQRQRRLQQQRYHSGQKTPLSCFSSRFLPLSSTSSRPIHHHDHHPLNDSDDDYLKARHQQTTPSLEIQQMTRHARTMIDAAIGAVNPVEAIQNHVRLIRRDRITTRAAVVPTTSTPTATVLGGGGGAGGDDHHGSMQQQQHQQQPWILEIGAKSSSDSCRRAYYNLNDYDTIRIVAFGKASSAMATAVVQQLLVVPTPDEDEEESSSAHDDNTDIANKLAGIVICKDGHATPTEIEYLTRYQIQVREASHPVPDQRGVDASRQLLNLATNSRKNDDGNNNSACSEGRGRTLVIACISGGGSALFCTPHPMLSLQDLQQTNQFLLQSGWSIQEMNVIRKRLEIGKGGGLLQAAIGASGGGGGVAGVAGNGIAAAADLVSLVLSDVLGDPLDLIASGPTVPDTSTARDAWNLLQRVGAKNIDDVLPKAVVQLLQDQVKQELEEQEERRLQETGSSSDDKNSKEHITTGDGGGGGGGGGGLDNRNRASYFTCLVGNNALAVSAAARQAAALGYTPIVLGTQIEGEASTVAQVLVGMAQHVIANAANSAGNKKNNATKRTGNDYLFAMVSSLPAAFIMGGETTVTLPSSSNDGGSNIMAAAGKGGRNQELALAAALALHKYNLRQVVVASVGTDGTDGPTDAAGAIVDGGLIDRLFQSHTNDVVASSPPPLPGIATTPENEAVSALKRHDSYHYLARTDRDGNSPLVKTGPTGTNVADIMVVLIHGDSDPQS